MRLREIRCVRGLDKILDGLDKNVQRGRSRMQMAKPGLATRIRFIGGLRGHDCSDDGDASVRDCGTFAELGWVRWVENGAERAPRRRSRTRIPDRPWSLQVGDEVGQHGVSSGAHPHELDGDAGAVTHGPYDSHGTEEPGVDLHQDLSFRVEVGRGICFDAFDAASAQTQVAQPASKQGAVQRKACDLGVTTAGITRNATTIDELALVFLWGHGFKRWYSARGRSPMARKY